MAAYNVTLEGLDPSSVSAAGDSRRALITSDVARPPLSPRMRELGDVLLGCIAAGVEGLGAEAMSIGEVGPPADARPNVTVVAVEVDASPAFVLAALDAVLLGPPARFMAEVFVPCVCPGVTFALAPCARPAPPPAPPRSSVEVTVAFAGMSVDGFGEEQEAALVGALAAASGVDADDVVVISMEVVVSSALTLGGVSADDFGEVASEAFVAGLAEDLGVEAASVTVAGVGRRRRALAAAGGLRVAFDVAGLADGGAAAAVSDGIRRTAGGSPALARALAADGVGIVPTSTSPEPAKAAVQLTVAVSVEAGGEGAVADGLAAAVSGGAVGEAVGDASVSASVLSVVTRTGTATAAGPPEGGGGGGGGMSAVLLPAVVGAGAALAAAGLLAAGRAFLRERGRAQKPRRDGERRAEREERAQEEGAAPPTAAAWADDASESHVGTPSSVAAEVGHISFSFCAVAGVDVEAAAS